MLAGVPELLKDINATTTGSDPAIIGVYRDEAYFTTDEGELWKTDGTTEGTLFVANIGDGARTQGAVHNDRLYFFQQDASFSRMWLTDGTAAGTIIVREIADNWRPSYLQATSHLLFFIAKDTAHGSELWTSDGTALGTRMVKDIAPGVLSSLSEFVLVGDIAYFSANDGTHGRELWRSDGTEEGTVLVADIRVGIGSSNPGAPTDVNGTLFFKATDNTSNTWLWKTDGTMEGTELVKEIRVGATVNFNGQLYFSGGTSSLNLELWKSDGTAAGTVPVKDVNQAGGSQPVMYLVHDGLLYFQVTLNGLRPWKSDGTEIGTTQVRGFSYVPETGMAIPWGQAGDHIMFVTVDGFYETSLWSLDGSEVSRVRTFEYPTSWGGPSFSLGPNNIRVFVVNDGTNGNEIWRTDGTDEGTYILRDLDTTPTPNGSGPSEFVKVGDISFFLAHDQQHGRELWKTDGTEAGTILNRTTKKG